MLYSGCYGIVTVPSGLWFCRKCESQERAARVVSLASEVLKLLGLLMVVLSIVIVGFN